MLRNRKSKSKRRRKIQRTCARVESLELRNLLTGIGLTAVGTYESGVFDEGAAEIVAYDTASQKAFFTNADANSVGILDLSDPTDPTEIGSIDLSPFGDGPNSVAVNDGVVAVAIESDPVTDPGVVAFFDTAGTFISQVTVGALPDMLTFTPDGSKILVANEGEPDDGIDPEGSVSVIDMTGGPISATVSTIDFNAFDSQAETLANRGVRLFPGVFDGTITVSQDLEPEYVAVSPDGTQAFVALQEANAFAVIDMASEEVVDILSLGVKDHSRGLPSTETFTLPDIPIANGDGVPLETPTGQQVNLGGFSGLHLVSEVGDVLTFVTVPDRGPNPNTYSKDGLTQRPFALPDYQARIVEFEVNVATGDTAITNELFLTAPDGTTPITGRSNFVVDINGNQVDENPVDTLGVQLDIDPFGGDLEGIVIDPAGNYWMVDEYRPAIYKFDAAGVMLDRFIPTGTAALAGEPAGTFGTETLPEEYITRRRNRGFEAVALDADNNRLFAFIQTPLANPDRAASNASQVIRILEIDTTTGIPTAEYVYLLDDPASAARPGGRVDKIGDAVYLGDGRMSVIERDANVGSEANKYLFDIDLTGATNVLGLSFGAETLEQQTPEALAAAGIQPVNKIKLANLPSIGYAAGDKPEGLTLLADGSLAVLNDNDFQLADVDIFDNDGNPLFGGGVVFQDSPTPSTLGIISFAQSNALDASDRDDAINIQNHPVYGMSMPDAITSFEAGGQTFYISANEGDARSEDDRVKDLTLDPTSFPNAAALQQDEVLGRYEVSTIDGDLDGDGDFDQLFGYGARSFTIFDAFGNRVFDSGDDFEQITAAAFPDNFNATNDENDFDSRSDAKGPEPEAVTTGVINGRTFAFIGLERIGGIMVYDVTDPSSPTFEQYINNRDFAGDAELGTAGDLGVEDLKFVSADDSPNGAPLLLAANEVSGTVTVFQVSGTIFNDGVLEIITTNDKDDIKVKDKKGGEIEVEIKTKPAEKEKGKGKGKEEKTKERYSDVDLLIIRSAGGDDKIKVDKKVEIDAMLFGGSGKDKLEGGGGLNLLDGGSGDDKLKGGDQSDILIGGTGKDKLDAKKDDDVLIGGLLANDVNQVFADWQDGALDVLSLIVIDDEEKDELKGGKDADVFFDGLGDKLKDVKKKDGDIVI